MSDSWLLYICWMGLLLYFVSYVVSLYWSLNSRMVVVDPRIQRFSSQDKDEYQKNSQLSLEYFISKNIDKNLSFGFANDQVSIDNVKIIGLYSPDYEASTSSYGGYVGGTHITRSSSDRDRLVRDKGHMMMSEEGIIDQMRSHIKNFKMGKQERIMETISDYVSYISSCSSCGGSGSDTCWSCGGSGSVTNTNHYTDSNGNSQTETVQETCTSCGGSGRQTCSYCGGSGDESEVTSMHYVVDASIASRYDEVSRLFEKVDILEKRIAIKDLSGHSTELSRIEESVPHPKLKLISPHAFPLYEAHLTITDTTDSYHANVTVVGNDYVLLDIDSLLERILKEDLENNQSFSFHPIRFFQFIHTHIDFFRSKINRVIIEEYKKVQNYAQTVINVGNACSEEYAKKVLDSYYDLRNWFILESCFVTLIMLYIYIETSKFDYYVAGVMISGMVLMTYIREKIIF